MSLFWSLWGDYRIGSLHVCCYMFIYCIISVVLISCIKTYVQYTKKCHFLWLLTVLSRATCVIALKHTLVDSHISMWKEEWDVSSIGWSSIILNWIFKTTTCLFWERLLLFCWVRSPPPSPAACNFQTICRHWFEKNCSHNSSSCCHLVAGFSKLHNHVTGYQQNASHLGLFCVFGFT